jgi:hypothetical protein
MATAMDDAPQPKPKPKPKWAWLIGPWLVFLALVAAWTIWWFTLADQTQKALAAAGQGLEGGARLTFATSETSGFPFRLLVRLTDPRLSTADGEAFLAAPRASLAVNPLNPEHLLVLAENPIRLKGLDLDWTITAETAQASLRALNRPGGEARLALTKAKINDPAGAATEIARGTIALRRDPADASARQISVDLRGFQPGATKGLEGFGAAPRDVFAGLVVEEADLITPGPDPLAAWAQAGAKLRIEQLNWRTAGAEGAPTLAAKGAFSLDAARRPVGQLALDAPDPAGLLAAIAQSATLTPQTRTAAQAFAAGQGLAGGAIGLTINAQDGRWRLGPIDLGPGDPVYRTQQQE